MLACNRHSTSVASALIRAGATLNDQDRLVGASALMIAADGGVEKLLQLLIHAGAVHARDKKGKQASAYARAAGHGQLASWLTQLERTAAAANSGPPPPLPRQGQSADGTTPSSGEPAAASD